MELSYSTPITIVDGAALFSELDAYLTSHGWASYAVTPGALAGFTNTPKLFHSRTTGSLNPFLDPPGSEDVFIVLDVQGSSLVHEVFTYADVTAPTPLVAADFADTPSGGETIANFITAATKFEILTDGLANVANSGSWFGFRLIGGGGVGSDTSSWFFGGVIERSGWELHRNIIVPASAVNTGTDTLVVPPPQVPPMWWSPSKWAAPIERPKVWLLERSAASVNAEALEIFSVVGDTITFQTNIVNTYTEDVVIGMNPLAVVTVGNATAASVGSDAGFVLYNGARDTTVTVNRLPALNHWDIGDGDPSALNNGQYVNRMTVYDGTKLLYGYLPPEFLFVDTTTLADDDIIKLLDKTRTGKRYYKLRRVTPSFEESGIAMRIA